MYQIVDSQSSTGIPLASAANMKEAVANAAYWAQELGHDMEIHAPDGIYEVAASQKLQR